MKKKRLGPAKAKTMLKDNSANGRPLSDKQKKLFQAVSHGMKQTKVVRKRGFFGFGGGSKSTSQAPKPQGQALKGGLGAAFGSKMGSLMHPGNISLRKLKRGMKGYAR